jgi:hypothetical protein
MPPELPQSQVQQTAVSQSPPDGYRSGNAVAVSASRAAFRPRSPSAPPGEACKPLTARASRCLSTECPCDYRSRVPLGHRSVRRALAYEIRLGALLVAAKREDHSVDGSTGRAKPRKCLESTRPDRQCVPRRPVDVRGQGRPDVVVHARLDTTGGRGRFLRPDAPQGITIHSVRGYASTNDAERRCGLLAPRREGRGPSHSRPSGVARLRRAPEAVGQPASGGARVQDS